MITGIKTVNFEITGENGKIFPGWCTILYTDREDKKVVCLNNFYNDPNDSQRETLKAYLEIIK